MEATQQTLTRGQLARRTRVIAAAMELAAEGGYDAVQMRDVAATAGVALGTIYRYFASKDHLLAAGLVEWAQDLERRVRQRPPRGETPADRVVDVVRRATRALERQPRLAAALLTAVSSPDPAVAECQRQVTVVMGSVLSGPLADVEERRRAAIVRVLSHVWFSALLGWVHGWVNAGPAGDELETAVRLMVR